MVLGLIVGAANDDLPEDLMQGLTVCFELQAEIDAFADLALSGERP